MMNAPIRPALGLALVLTLTGGTLTLRAAEVVLGGIGGEVDVCDGVTRTTNWTNTTGMPIYMRTLELRQVTNATFSTDVRAIVWVVRSGTPELIMAENWKGRSYSDVDIRTVNLSLAPDYIAIHPGDELRMDRQCVVAVNYGVTLSQQILYFRYATTVP